jgi:hypothetical protein
MVMVGKVVSRKNINVAATFCKNTIQGVGNRFIKLSLLALNRTYQINNKHTFF